MAVPLEGPILSSTIILEKSGGRLPWPALQRADESEMSACDKSKAVGPKINKLRGLDEPQKDRSTHRRQVRWGGRERNEKALTQLDEA